MVKAVYLLHKRPDMDWVEFQRYWTEVHAPMVAKLPGLRRYVQGHAVPEAGDRPCDGIAELWFDSAASMQASLASPEGKTALADVPNFLDASKLGRIVVEEVQVV